MTRLLALSLLAVLVVALFSVSHHKPATEPDSAVPVAVSVQAVEPSPAVVRTSHRRSSLHRPPHRHRLNWAALAWCESRGHWQDNTGNGYYGGLQQTVEFWRSWGGLRYAARADLAARREQIRVAHNALKIRGSEPWPSCGWHL